MSPDLLFGMETEYAFSRLREAGGEGGAALSRTIAIRELLALARERCECLRDIAGKGVYFANGGRLYLDTGEHPELNTPECSDPAELVLYQLAGERILSDLASQLDARHPGGRASFFRCNFDYESAQTWGCHESYLYRERQGAMAAELVPHLVTRPIYTGAGGFDTRSPGISFSLSPRVSHLVRVVSRESTELRGIFHTKDEPLAGGGYHRLHLICGESLCSAAGNYLKIGTTALVVRLIEAGLCDGRAMTLVAPLASMRRIAADPTCSIRLRLRSRREVSAVEVQRHYLAAAERALGRSCMPGWAPELCRRWREALDRIEGPGEELATTFDWAIKLELFRAHAVKRGFELEEIARCNTAMEALRGEGAAPRRGEGAKRGRVPSDTLARCGVAPEELQAFRALRAELFEIDARFGQRDLRPAGSRWGARASPAGAGPCRGGRARAAGARAGPCARPGDSRLPGHGAGLRGGLAGHLRPRIGAHLRDAGSLRARRHVDPVHEGPTPVA